MHSFSGNVLKTAWFDLGIDILFPFFVHKTSYSFHAFQFQVCKFYKLLVKKEKKKEKYKHFCIAQIF